MMHRPYAEIMVLNAGAHASASHRTCPKQDQQKPAKSDCSHGYGQQATCVAWNQAHCAEDHGMEQ